MWGWLAMTAAVPDVFVSALQEVASQLVPVRDTGRRAVREMQLQPPPYSVEEMRELASQMEELGKVTRLRTKAEALKTP